MNKVKFSPVLLVLVLAMAGIFIYSSCKSNSAADTNAFKKDKEGVTQVTDSNFEAFIKSAGDKVVMVDCWATWCGPCKMMGPVVADIAKEEGDKILVGKLDVDENPKTAEKYRLASIPAFLIIKNGKVVETPIGAMEKERLKSKLAKYM
jgi:thioredoxin 1